MNQNHIQYIPNNFNNNSLIYTKKSIRKYNKQ